MKTDIETLRRADWAGVEREVVGKLRLLRAMVGKLEPGGVNDRIAQDLILPALGAIGQFCTMVTVEAEGGAGRGDGAELAELRAKTDDVVRLAFPDGGCRRAPHYWAARVREALAAEREAADGEHGFRAEAHGR